MSEDLAETAGYRDTALIPVASGIARMPDRAGTQIRRPARDQGPPLRLEAVEHPFHAENRQG